jgi:hypothetical protein
MTATRKEESKAKASNNEIKISSCCSHLKLEEAEDYEKNFKDSTL